MNSKSANSKSANRPAGRAEARGGKATARAKPARPGEKDAAGAKDSAGGMYGRYREDTPAPRPAPHATPPKVARLASPQAGPSTATADLAAAVRAMTAEVKALKNEAAQKDAEIKALDKRLTQLEARQKAQEKAYRASQAITGQAFTGQADAGEAAEERSA